MQTLYYIAFIDWGDGSSPSSGTVASDGYGGFTVTGTHTYSDAGNYNPAVTVTADDSRTGTGSGSANVSSLSAMGSSFSAEQGADFFGTVANFTDSTSGTNASDYNATIDWGDGNESSGVIVSDGSGGFNVIGTNNFVQAGTLSTTITISDPYGGVVTVSGTATVAGLTASGQSVNAVQGSSYSGVLATFADNASDESGQTYTAVIDWGDGSSTSTGTVDSITGGYTVSGTHTYDAAGYQSPTITILASDGRSVAAYASVAVAGLTVNEDDVNATAGTSFSGTVADFTDSAPDGPVQSYTASIDWGDTNSSSGTVTSDGEGGFTVTGTHTYSTAGNYTPTVTVTASDSRTGVASDFANVTSVTVTGETVGPEQGVSFTGEVATFVDSNSGTTAEQYSASIDWGDGNTSSGVIVSDGSGGFTVSGTNTYEVAGTFNPTITIIDPNGGEATGTATANVAGISFTPQTITEDQGSSFTGTELTDFVDTASDHSGQTYTAVIDWGDGSSTSTGTVASDGSGGFTVSGSHTYDNAGSYSPTIIVSATDGRVVTSNATANVNGLTTDSENINAVQGTAFTGLQVADFDDSASDAGTQTYTASIDWGDGSSASSGTVISDSDGGFIITGSHTFSTAGNYSVLVTITATDDRTVEAHISANVTTLTATGETVTPDAGTTFTEVLANFTDANSGTSAGDYNATINWGDGNTSNGVITSDGSGGFNVSATYMYAFAGAFNPVVTITDPSGATATVTATASVGGLTATSESINAIQSDSLMGVFANFTDNASDISGLTYTASIDWSDGSSSSTGTVTSDGDGGYNVTTTKTFSTLGQTNAMVTIAASDGRSIVAVSKTDISTVTVTGLAISGAVGENFTGEVATFTDFVPGTLYSNYTASIDWGDDNTSMGTVAASGSGFTVTGTNTFASSGSLTVTITIIQSNGGFATATTTATVAAVKAPVLTATAVSDSTINLSFTPNSFHLELLEQGPDDDTFHVIDMPTESGGVYPITGLESDKPYRFELRADNGQVADYSLAAGAIADVGDDSPDITGYNYDSTTNLITLTWSEPDTDITEFTVYECAVEPGVKPVFDWTDGSGTGGGGSYSITVNAGGVHGEGLSLEDAPIDSGLTAYQFYIQGGTTEGADPTTAPSNVVTVRTPLQLAVPTLTETVVGDTTTFSWSSVPGANNYLLEYDDPTGYLAWDGFEFPTLYDSSTTSVSLPTSETTGLVFALEAEKDNSGGWPWYAQSNIVGTLSESASTAPTNLTAFATRDGKIDLLWNDKSNNETGFTIQRSKDATFSSDLTTFTVGADVGSYMDSSATPRVIYYYRVEAFNTGTEGQQASGWSATANAYVVGTWNVIAPDILQTIKNIDDIDYQNASTLGPIIGSLTKQGARGTTLWTMLSDLNTDNFQSGTLSLLFSPRNSLDVGSTFMSQVFGKLVNQNGLVKRSALGQYVKLNFTTTSVVRFIDYSTILLPVTDWYLNTACANVTNINGVRVLLDGVSTAIPDAKIGAMNLIPIYNSAILDGSSMHQLYSQLDNHLCNATSAQLDTMRKALTNQLQALQAYQQANSENWKKLSELAQSLGVELTKIQNMFKIQP